MITRVSLLLSLSLLSACASYSTGRGIPAPVESRDNSTSVIAPPSAQPSGGTINTPIQRRELPSTQTIDPRPGTALPPTTNEQPATASSTLLQGVDAAIAQGDLERAAALCERALRISPRDALLWYRLASVRAQQGRLNEAEGFAQRALSFSNADRALEAQIQALLRSI